MMDFAVVLLLVLFAVVLCPDALAASKKGDGLAAVWAVNDGEKVKKDDLDNPNKYGNSTWDGRKIRVFGARNEVVAFQVILQAGPQGAEGLHCELTPLVRKSGARAIRNTPADPGDINNYVGRRIELFTEHYLNVTRRSKAGLTWAYWAPASEPKDCGGWLPDALIPLSAKAGKGGSPFSVAPGENLGIWVDIYIPRERTCRAGIYKGKFRIGKDGKLTREIPVELKVFDFTLPDQTHTMTMVAASGWDNRHRTILGDKAEDAYRKMAHRHRFDILRGENFGRLNWRKKYFDGTAYTKANGYEGPGEGVGEQIYAVGLYGRPVLGKTKETHQREAARWVRWFDENASWMTYYWYIRDEPLTPEAKAWVNERAEWVHSAPPPANRLKVLTTVAGSKSMDKLEGSIDIWCIHTVKLELARIREEERKGRPCWFYNGHRPHASAMTFDSAAVEYRVNPWLRYRYDIPLWFLWETTHWRHNHQGPRAHQHQNIWHDPITFMSSKEVAGMGNGTLFYPGEDRRFPEEDRGVAGPLSSIRMKNLRRGLQDYEYLWLLEQAGLKNAADEAARRMVPRAFSEAKVHQYVPWSEVGSDWDKMRLELARILEAKYRGK